HMVFSKHTSAHVHSVFEVNFSRVAQIREAKRAEFERAGAKLTYLSFIIKAAVDALHAVPVVNASVDGDSIVYHKAVHLGIAIPPMAHLTHVYDHRVIDGAVADQFMSIVKRSLENRDPNVV